MNTRDLQRRLLKLFLSIFISINPYNIYAQDINNIPNFKIGARIYYDVSGNTSVSTGKGASINYGIDVQYLNLSKHFHIQTGVYKITKATLFNAFPNTFTTLNLPLGVVYENNYFYLIGGVYYERTLTYNRGYPTPYVEKKIKNFNYGIYAGLGIEKNINTLISYTSEIRILWNINNYDRPEGFGTNKTVGFSFGIHYKI
jgi:hypothetical protein